MPLVTTCGTHAEFKTIHTEIHPIGAILPDQNIISMRAIEHGLHNVLSIRQIGNSCVPTTIRMVLMSYGINKSQSWLNECTKYDPKTGTFMDDANKCLISFIDSENIRNVKIKDLKERDIVLYEIDNETNHACAVDYIEDDLIILSNPWGQYDAWNKSDFKKVFTGEIIRINW